MIAVGVAFFVPETILVDLQQWRGVPSHFNVRTERSRVSERAAVIAVVCCVLRYGLLLAAATLQTYSGLSPLALTPLALPASLVGAALVAGPYLRGLSALRRPSLA